MHRGRRSEVARPEFELLKESLETDALVEADVSNHQDLVAGANRFPGARVGITDLYFGLPTCQFVG